MGARRDIPVGRPRLEISPAGSRVTADVGGTAVWFESPDVRLAPSAESFVSALLVPALDHHARLVSEAPLDRKWLAGSRQLVKLFHEWWRYPQLAPEGPVADDDARAAHATRPAARDGAAATAGRPAASPRVRAMFFSGGVDSFHGLLCSGERIELLVFVQGFDIPLGDAARLDAALAGARAVGREVGVPVALVRTNLREHPLVSATSWERANGGALAAVGHVLGDAVHEMLIPSSVAMGRERAWGSHWKSDPLFSSRSVRLRQLGQRLRKIDKIRAIANQPLPQRHLRVCWENRTPTGNCSKCGKCVLTRLVLAECGVLDRFTTLEGTASLAADVDALRADSHRRSLTDLAASTRLDPDLHRAVCALLDRIRHAQSWPVRARRAALRTLLAWSRPGRA